MFWAGCLSEAETVKHFHLTRQSKQGRSGLKTNKKRTGGAEGRTDIFFSYNQGIYPR